CDRVALINGGEVAAIDSPAGLISQVEREQIIRFRPSGAFDDAVLTALPEVSRVRRSGGSVEVAGTGNLILVVSQALAEHGVTPIVLRADRAPLDAAVLVLSGSRLSADRPPPSPTLPHPFVVAHRSARHVQAVHRGGQALPPRPRRPVLLPP